MRLSEIRENHTTDLSAKVTVALSISAKRSIDLIATAKNKTPSEVVREIVEMFLANNQEELKAL